jgi:hypothetical protein
VTWLRTGQSVLRNRKRGWNQQQWTGFRSAVYESTLLKLLAVLYSDIYEIKPCFFTTNFLNILTSPQGRDSDYDIGYDDEQLRAHIPAVE